MGSGFFLSQGEGRKGTGRGTPSGFGGLNFNVLVLPFRPKCCHSTGCWSYATDAALNPPPLPGPGWAPYLRHSKVDQFDAARQANHNVGRLDVLVDDPMGMDPFQR